jgi:hypothetical protein
MGRIHEQDRKVPFEQIENGLPIHPRTLHGDHRTPLGLEPRPHGEEVSGHRPKGADLFLPLPLAIMGHQAHFDVLFVDIHASTGLMQHAHRGFPPAACMVSSPTHVLQRISSKDKSPLRAPRVGATSGGAAKMRASDFPAGSGHQRFPDVWAATWSPSIPQGRPIFIGRGA